MLHPDRSDGRERSSHGAAPGTQSAGLVAVRNSGPERQKMRREPRCRCRHEPDVRNVGRNSMRQANVRGAEPKGSWAARLAGSGSHPRGGVGRAAYRPEARPVVDRARLQGRYPARGPRASASPAQAQRVVNAARRTPGCRSATGLATRVNAWSTDFTPIGANQTGRQPRGLRRFPGIPDKDVPALGAQTSASSASTCSWPARHGATRATRSRPRRCSGTPSGWSAGWTAGLPSTSCS